MIAGPDRPERLEERREDRTEDDIDPITPDELGRPRRSVAHDPGHIRVREADERQRARLIGDHCDLDRSGLR